MDFDLVKTLRYGRFASNFITSYLQDVKSGEATLKKRHATFQTLKTETRPRHSRPRDYIFNTLTNRSEQAGTILSHALYDEATLFF